MKRSVREAALSLRSCNSESSRDSQSDESSEHFFVPLSETSFSNLDADKRGASLRSKRLFVSQMDDSLLESHASGGHGERKFDEFPDMLNDLERLSVSDYDNVNGFLSYPGSNSTSDARRSIFDFEDAQDQVFSPPLLMDSSLLTDPFEDLLGMLNFQQCFGSYHLIFFKCFAYLKYSTEQEKNLGGEGVGCRDF